MDKEPKPAKPAAEDANLLAFATILGGLLASGHYTWREGESNPELMRVNYGKEWKEIAAFDRHVSGQFVPAVMEPALELFEAAKIVAQNPDEWRE